MWNWMASDTGPVWTTSGSYPIITTMERKKEDDLDECQGIFFDTTLGEMIGMVIVCGNYMFGKGPVKMMEDSKTWTNKQWMAARLLTSKK